MASASAQPGRAPTPSSPATRSASSATKIGSTAEKTIAEAREIARVVIGRVEQGLPAFEPPKPKADLVAVVLAEWLKRHVDKNGLRSAPDIPAHHQQYTFCRIGANAPSRSCAAATLPALLDFIEDEHGAAQADAVLSALNRRQLVARPQRRLRSAVVGIKSRVAKPDRKPIAPEAMTASTPVRVGLAEQRAFGGFVRPPLLTAQRADKVRTLRRSDISPDGVWTIRTEKREKGNAGVLQLPALALDIISRPTAARPQRACVRRHGWRPALVLHSPQDRAGQAGRRRRLALARLQANGALAAEPRWRAARTSPNACSATPGPGYRGHLRPAPIHGKKRPTRCAGWRR